MLKRIKIQITTGAEETKDSITLPRMITNIARAPCKLVTSPLQIYTPNKPRNANLVLLTKKNKEWRPCYQDKYLIITSENPIYLNDYFKRKAENIFMGQMK